MDSSRTSPKMEPEASQVAAVCQVPTGSTQPAGANTGEAVCQPNHEDRKRGHGRLLQTKLNISGESDPNLGNKINLDLDEKGRSGKVEKGKTKMDTTEHGIRGFQPAGMKDYMVYLNSEPLGDDEVALAYHEDFLREVFGSTIPVAFSSSIGWNAFVVWLTEEEAQILLGRKEVAFIEYTATKKSRRN